MLHYARVKLKLMFWRTAVPSTSTTHQLPYSHIPEYSNSQQNCLFFAVHMYVHVHMHAHTYKIITLHPLNIRRCKCQLHSLNRSWDGSVSIVTRLWAAQSWVALVETTSNISSVKHQEQTWGPPSLLLNAFWGLSPGAGWLWHKVNHLPPPNAEVKNKWCYISAPPTCIHSVHRD